MTEASAKSPTQEYDEISDRQYFTRARRAELAKKYDIPSDKMDEFCTALRKACRLYLLNAPLDDDRKGIELASRGDARDLLKLLTKAGKILATPGMQTRLHAGLQKGGGETKTDRSDSVAEAMIQNLAALTKAIERSVAFDGRGVRWMPSHTGLIAAAQSLHAFWVSVLRRPKSVQNRGGRRTKALEFLLDVLRILDPGVRESWFRAGREPGSVDLYIIDVVPPWPIAEG